MGAGISREANDYRMCWILIVIASVASDAKAASMLLAAAGFSALSQVGVNIAGWALLVAVALVYGARQKHGYTERSA
jgi:hypothetical protein